MPAQRKSGMAGRMHAPGCADPDVPVAASTTTVGEDGVPEFGAPNPAIGVSAGDVKTLDPNLGIGKGLVPVKSSQMLDPALPVGGNTAIGMGTLKAPTDVGSSASASPAKGKKDKPPLFTKAEILARISDVEDSLKKLRDMIDKVLE